MSALESFISRRDQIEGLGAEVARLAEALNETTRLHELANRKLDLTVNGSAEIFWRELGEASPIYRAATQLMLKRIGPDSEEKISVISAETLRVIESYVSGLATISEVLEGEGPLPFVKISFPKKKLTQNLSGLSSPRNHDLTHEYVTGINMTAGRTKPKAGLVTEHDKEVVTTATSISEILVPRLIGLTHGKATTIRTETGSFDYDTWLERPRTSASKGGVIEIIESLPTWTEVHTIGRINYGDGERVEDPFPQTGYKSALLIGEHAFGGFSALVGGVPEGKRDEQAFREAAALLERL